MKRLMVLIAILGLAVQAAGETIGSSSEGGGSFMFSRPQAPAPAPPERVVPIRVSQPVAAPMPPKRPDNLMVPASDVADAPYKPSLVYKNDSSCPDPEAHPNARNTPVKVYVDQQTQTVFIDSPDEMPENIDIKDLYVSTGGGLKVPNGKIKKPPYCARTPSKDRLIVSAVTPEMFEGTGCTPDQIRSKSTVFEEYYTRTFTDKKGNPIPMPKAVRIVGGIFFHEVPPSYKKMLGHNVSGECVRLAPKTAAFLKEQILKYGAIEVNIGEPPIVGREMPQYCDEEMVANAMGRTMRQNEVFPSAPQYTGSEDVYGGEDNFFSMLGRALRGERQRPRQRVPRRAYPVDGSGGLY